MASVDRTVGCLFCGNRQGRFESEEHVIPLALGNAVASGLVEDEFVIPPGEICDKCNRRRLSLRDKALAEWPPISVFRSLGQVANRRGQLVDAVAGTRWDIALNPKDPRRFVLFALANTGPRSNRDDVARALCKIALETRWLDYPLDARSARWNPIASAAIGGPLPASLLMGLTHPDAPENVNLAPESRVFVDDDFAALRIFGLTFVTGLQLSLLINSHAPLVPRTAWWSADSATGVLTGPDSFWGRFEGAAARATRTTAASSMSSAKNRSALPTEPGAQLYLHRSSES